MPSPESAKSSGERIKIAPQLANGWPADTPDLRDIYFKVSVTDKRKKFLERDGSGFLIIQHEDSSTAAKLSFYNDKEAFYRIPVGRYNILSVGSSNICRNLGFDIPTENANAIHFEVDIELWDDTPKILRGAYIKFVSDITAGSREVVGSVCRTQSAWKKFDERFGKGKPSGGQVAAGATVGAGVVALTIMKVLVTIAALPVMLGGGGQ